MKKVIFTALVATTLFACQSKTEKSGVTYPANATAYSVKASDNIETVKKALTAGLSSDSATTKLLYADSAVIYDNNTKQTLSENMKLAGILKSQGVTIKLESIDEIWEGIPNKPAKNGATSFVHVYMTTSFTKAGKKVDCFMNALFSFKDGKIIEEWGIYDASEIVELVK